MSGLEKPPAKDLTTVLADEGFITYMRTDGVTISDEAIAMIRETIAHKFGHKGLVPEPRKFK